MTVSNEDRKEHGFLAYIRQLRTMGSCVTHMTEIIAKTPAELRWRSGSNSWFEPVVYSKHYARFTHHYRSHHRRIYNNR